MITKEGNKMMNNFEKYDMAVSDYIRECTSIGISGTTISNYSRRLKYFREFLEKRVPNGEVSADSVRSWRDSMLDSGKSLETVKQYLIELNAFFTFATDETRSSHVLFESNPVNKKMYPRIKPENKKPYDKILDAEDLKKLWANERTSYTDKLWARNYAIITLLLDGKIRNAELLDLKLSDIHLASEIGEDIYSYIIVSKGKGNKYREVDLNEISATALKLYLKSGIRPEGLSDDDFLFGTTAEKKFGGTSRGNDQWHRGTSQWLSKLVERHVRMVTGKAGFRTHSMRHNGAIMELNSGTSMESLQAELGHSSVQTTHIYAGRLQSRRNRMNMAAVTAERDAWAEKNREMLA